MESEQDKMFYKIGKANSIPKNKVKEKVETIQTNKKNKMTNSYREIKKKKNPEFESVPE